MLNVNVGNPKALEAAILSAVKFADTSQYNTLPSCNIMVKSAEKGLTLTATDLYTSVEFAVNSSDVIEDGEFCIPAKNLKKLGEIIKDQSAISLEQTENGLELSLFDAYTFGARFEVEETDEFPMLSESDPNAHWIEFNSEHIALVKALAKYAETNTRRVGYDAVQFAMCDDDTLLAYATDGDALAYAKLGRTRIPNFAIPVDAVKKTLQVANIPDLKKSDWRITLPTEDREVINIQIQNTVVNFRAGDAIDLTDWITKRIMHHANNNDYLAFEPKALTDGLKKVASLFSKEKKNTNFVVIEGDAKGNITMTAEVYNKYSYTYYPVETDTEYIHNFTAAGAQRVMGDGDFKIRVEGKKFQNMVKDLAKAKPKFIQNRGALCR